MPRSPRISLGTGAARLHVNSDLGAFLLRCADRQLDPLTADRPHLDLYVRWMQEARGFKPSKVSRRMSVVTGLYRTCVIDCVLEHSPAEFVTAQTCPGSHPPSA